MTIKKTPLYDEHVKLGAKIVDFAGYKLPVQYSGVIDEHNSVRNHVGMFDVSHMGQVFVTGKGAFKSMQNLTPNDVSKLSPGKAQYSMLLNEKGTIVDDIIVYMQNENSFLIVVNASNKEKDFNWIKSHLLSDSVAADKSYDYGVIAVQGPEAANVVQSLTDTNIADLEFFGFTNAKINNAGECIVARTGYTGEDGFEIFSAPKNTPKIWQALLDQGVKPAGLGARDTLRLEAKMSLYGNDIDDTTNPLEASLGWVIKIEKGDFIGKKALLEVKEKGLQRKLIGFKMVDPGIARHGYKIVDNGKEIGVVTSGAMSPTLNEAIGLAYVPIKYSNIDSEFKVDIRGKERLARVVKTPFYKRNS